MRSTEKIPEGTKYHYWEPAKTVRPKFKSMVEENSKVFQGIVTASNLIYAVIAFYNFRLMSSVFESVLSVMRDGCMKL